MPLGTTSQVVLDPIERDTTGTLVVKVVKTPEHYWLVEARRPIGYDGYFRTLYAPATPAEALGHPSIQGVFVTRVKQPSTSSPPVWEGLGLWGVSEALEVGPPETAAYVDEEENLLVAVVGEVGDSYIVEVTTAEEVVEIRGLIDQVSEEIGARLREGVSNEEAEEKLLEGESKSELALQAYLQYDLELARSLAEEAESLLDQASRLEAELQNQQLYLLTGGAIAVVAISAIAFMWRRRRGKATSGNSNNPGMFG